MSKKSKPTLDTAQEVADGTPAFIDRDFIRIKFQLGPVAEVGVNGCQIEDIIDILVARLQGFQRGKFANEYNSQAIDALKLAKYWLDRRTADRVRRGVEGKNEK